MSPRSAGTSVLGHIQQVAQEDPVQAGIMLLQSACTPDPADPLKQPWSEDAGIMAYKRVVGPLTEEQEALVRAGWQS